MNVPNSLPQYVEFQSRKDLSYDRRFNPKVNCQAFYGEVCNRLSREGDVSPITVVRLANASSPPCTPEGHCEMTLA
jgi:hypothetical protein